MTSSQEYMRQLLIPAQCALSSPILRAVAVFLSNGMMQTPIITEAMAEEAIQVMLMANRGTTADDLSACLKRLREVGWKFSKGDEG